MKKPLIFFVFLLFASVATAQQQPAGTLTPKSPSKPQPVADDQIDTLGVDSLDANGKLRRKAMKRGTPRGFEGPDNNKPQTPAPKSGKNKEN